MLVIEKWPEKNPEFRDDNHQPGLKRIELSSFTVNS